MDSPHSESLSGGQFAQNLYQAVDIFGGDPVVTNQTEDAIIRSVNQNVALLQLVDEPVCRHGILVEPEKTILI